VGNFNGKGEYNSEALNNLPTGYLNQIDNMLSKSILNFYYSDKWLDTYNIEITNEDKKAILLIEINKENVIIEYDPELFYFRYIPLSYPQKRTFIKQLFKKHFEDDIKSKLESIGEIEVDFQNVYYGINELKNNSDL
jgi:hypothetical protein